MTGLTPFLLSPVFSERPWGGDRLSRYGKALPERVTIGERMRLKRTCPDFTMANGLGAPLLEQIHEWVAYNFRPHAGIRKRDGTPDGRTTEH